MKQHIKPCKTIMNHMATCQNLVEAFVSLFRVCVGGGAVYIYIYIYIYIRPRASNPEGNVSEVPYGHLVLVLNIVKGPQQGLPKFSAPTRVDFFSFAKPRAHSAGLTTLFWHAFFSLFCDRLFVDFGTILGPTWLQLRANLDYLESKLEPSWLQNCSQEGWKWGLK